MASLIIHKDDPNKLKITHYNYYHDIPYDIS